MNLAPIGRWRYMVSSTTISLKKRIYNPLLLSIRIHMFLGLQDPDPLVRGMDPDPDPSIIMQKSLKNDVNVPSKSNKEKKLLKH
jgi:hypothetical protein